MYRKLRVIDGPLAGTEYLLGRRTTIGRSGDLEVQLLSKSVSREHARLEIAEDGHTMFLRDLGSKNGTFVGGNPVLELELGSGQQFQIGNSTFLYEEVAGHPAVEDELPMLAVLGGRADEVTSLFNSPFASARLRKEEPTIFPVADGTGPCQDPLHVTAKENGWAFCPVCGATPE